MSRRARLATLLIIVVLSVTACDRLPLSNPADPGSGVDFSDPDVGGGAGVETGPQTPIPTATPTGEASPRLDEAARATAESFPPTAEPTAAPTVASSTTAPTLEPTAENEQPASEPTPAPETATPEASPTQAGVPNEAGEIIHIVQSGENLYRIGLQYGISWVVIAEYNGITNPDAISAGQEIKIPPTPTPTPETQSALPAGDDSPPIAGEDDPVAASDSPAQVGGSSPPSAVVVTVGPGDTLYAIAQRYGVSWDQIAEANGLAAPNQIHAGQALKIPADVPGLTPEFTHQVRRGETLTGIARQYGLSAAELAEANGLVPPYVIYPGQALTIPGE